MIIKINNSDTIKQFNNTHTSSYQASSWVHTTMVWRAKKLSLTGRFPDSIRRVLERRIDFLRRIFLSNHKARQRRAHTIQSAFILWDTPIKRELSRAWAISVSLLELEKGAIYVSPLSMRNKSRSTSRTTCSNSLKEKTQSGFAAQYEILSALRLASHSFFFATDWRWIL